MIQTALVFIASVPTFAFGQPTEDFIATIEEQVQTQILEHLEIIKSGNLVASCLLFPNSSDVLADHSFGVVSTDQAKMLLAVTLLQDKAAMMEAGFSGMVPDEVCTKKYNPNINADFTDLVDFGISYVSAR